METEQGATTAGRLPGGVDALVEAQILLAAGIDLQRAGRAREAIEAYGRAIAVQPDLVEAYHNLGVALRAAGCTPASVACFRRALRLRPGHGPTLSNLGNALRSLGETEDAVQLLRQAAAADPQSPEIAYNCALALRDAGQVADAVRHFDRSLELRPDRHSARIERGLAHLLGGNFTAGFADLALRHPAAIVPVRGKSWPRWDGRTLDGRHLLVRAGDDLAETALFARFVPLAAQRGVPVILEGPDDAVPLLETVEGVARVARRGGRFANVAAEAPLADLPRILGVTLETIPSGAPYLRVPRQSRHEPPPAVAGRIRVGVQWSTGPVEPDARSPNCRLAHFLRLAERPDVDLVSLQAGAQAEIAEAGAAALVREIEGIEDPSVLAAAVASTDLVVAVDGPAAHLAGALGHPVWLVLPYAAEWWWLLGRDDSPWYPSAWLFRQRRPGDWDPVLRRVRTALDAALDAPPAAAGAPADA
ncbi:tetratricopeptide repeat protein [Stella sp.]|uniref:tetratricopeptide repeat protein n=1 Tax=Stella sp. TaxID=2912054 RepID=UPI0035B4686D